jgi:hypothetical protein
VNTKARVIRRISLLGLLFGLAVGATPGGGAPPTSSANPAKSSPSWIRTDLRTPTPEQVRRAAGRFAIACGKQTGQLLGNSISVAMADVALSGVLPEVAATQLACAFDAPVQATCADIQACEVGPTATPGPQAICAGSVLVATSLKTSAQLVSDCNLFGETCFTTDVGAACARGVCVPGETYSCSGNVMVSCVQGVRVASPCAPGLHCVSDCNGVVECRGSGSECSTSRCDGNTAVTCPPDAYGKTHEARVDCSPWGLSCQVQSFKDLPVVARCLPADQEQCDPASFKTVCNRDLLRTCVLGRVTELSCADLGFAGVCAPGGGAEGEATCSVHH